MNKNIEDFLENIREGEKVLAEYKRMLDDRKKFTVKLNTMLVDETIEYFPDKKIIKNEFINKLFKKCEWDFVQIFEDTNDLIHHYSKFDKYCFIKPPLNKKKEDEAQRKKHNQELLDLAGPEKRELAIQIIEEDEEYRIFYETFKNKLDSCIKKLILEYFPEINELSANGLRELSYLIYLDLSEILDGIYTYIED
ncbi:MAG: hypothetical protein JEY97_12150 [Bacteroidales bacterium]|nr:hypothetical protein [Bacteroidales bacterium]